MRNYLNTPLLNIDEEGSTGSGTGGGNNPQPDVFKETFSSVFGQIESENITPETIFETVLNSDFGKAKINELSGKVSQEAQSQHFEMIKGHLGFQGDESIKDIDSLTSRYGNKMLENYSKEDKELRKDLDKLNKSNAEFEAQNVSLQDTIAKNQSEYEQAVVNAEKRVRREMTIEKLIVMTDNLQPYIAKNPDLVRAKIENQLTSLGYKITDDNLLVHDGTKDTNDLAVYAKRGTKQLHLKDFIQSHLHEEGAIITQSVSGSGSFIKKNEPTEKKHKKNAFTNMAYSNN
jgi:hypothetical protein